MSAATAMAYKHCEWVTRTHARNFYYGIRLLPPHKRSAMCALYAMARRIDDVGDGDRRASGSGRHAAAETNGESFGTGAGTTNEKLTTLAEIRASLGLLSKAAQRSASSPASVPPGDPVLVALADAASRFPLPVSALELLVEGCEWDVMGRRYDTFEELVEYCRRVAGTIGRLSLAVYGSAEMAAAEPPAEALGVALQLTNILRDLLEDRDVMGRVYLPTEDLERFCIGPGLS
ncbi:MAG TPA: phytoene/squalene synthase family protein, partial [Acidimicrobiales bacterium]|nr:phytoene/squalene synthase family protein [Acidimicrobiales bacterium]